MITLSCRIITVHCTVFSLLVLIIILVILLNCYGRIVNCNHGIQKMHQHIGSSGGEMLLAFPGAFSGIFMGFGVWDEISHSTHLPHAATYSTWLPRFAEWGLPTPRVGECW